MYEWQKQIQIIVDEIDRCIRNYEDEALTLGDLARSLGYSEFHTTRKFKEISGMQFRDYLRHRKLAFALKEVRDSEKSILEIAVAYGFHPTRHLPGHSRECTASPPAITGSIPGLWSFAPK